MKTGDRVRVMYTIEAHDDESFFLPGMEGVLVDEWAGWPDALAEDTVLVLFESDARGNKDAWYVRKDQLELV